MERYCIKSLFEKSKTEKWIKCWKNNGSTVYFWSQKSDTFWLYRFSVGVEGGKVFQAGEAHSGFAEEKWPSENKNIAHHGDTK